MSTMIGLPSRRERSGPGGSPGLQNQWRGARRGAVGSTPTRSRHGGPDLSERPRPPSVERCWPPCAPAWARRVARRGRGRRAGGHRRRTVAARDRRGSGRHRRAGRNGRSAVGGLRRPGGDRPDPGPQRHRRRPPHEPRARAVAAGRHRGRDACRRRLLAARVRARRRPARAALPGRRDSTSSR